MLRDYFATHRKTRWVGLGLGALVLLIVLFLAFFDWNYFKPTLARMISEKTGRPTTIAGNLGVHLWSWNPSAEVDGLTMKNPAWAEHDVMFHADRLTVSVSLGRLLRGQLVLPRIEVIRPSVDLERDQQGRASWEFGDASGKPKTSAKPAKIPTIRRLLIEDGTVRVTDRIRKLSLDGSLNAADEAGNQSAGFTLKCSGTLNAKPFHAQIHGGPLVNLDPDHPYDLAAHLTASDITVDAHASFPKPFDLAAYRVKFSVSGSDLADIYYLTGLALPNTPPYQLAADVRHSRHRVSAGRLQGPARIERPRGRHCRFRRRGKGPSSARNFTPTPSTWSIWRRPWDIRRAVRRPPCSRPRTAHRRPPRPRNLRRPRIICFPTPTCRSIASAAWMPT